MWRIKNRPSNSTSCSDNALRSLVLVAGKLHWGLQVTSSFSIWGCVLKGCFERGILWRAKSRSKGVEDFDLEHWGLVSIVDHEAGPWKMAFFHNPTWWSDFHGPISQNIDLQSLWALTRCKPKVDQEEWLCTEKWTCWFYFVICSKMAILKRKEKTSLTILLSSLPQIFPLEYYYNNITLPWGLAIFHLTTSFAWPTAKPIGPY